MREEVSDHSLGRVLSRQIRLAREVRGDRDGIRTFIAVDLGKPLRDRCAALQETLARSGADVKWVEVENLHVSLLFLGEVDDREIATLCGYCGVGCGVLASVSNNEIISVRGDPAHPANFGRLCSKGLSLHKADPSFRALYPEIGGERKSWDEALDFVADKFSRTISLHGPDAVAFYVSGQFLTEDYYVFNKLAKGLIGTNNIDTNSRLCMASAVAGYKLGPYDFDASLPGQDFSKLGWAKD